MSCNREAQMRHAQRNKLSAFLNIDGASDVESYRTEDIWMIDYENDVYRQTLEMIQTHRKFIVTYYSKVLVKIFVTDAIRMIKL